MKLQEVLKKESKFYFLAIIFGFILAIFLIFCLYPFFPSLKVKTLKEPGQPQPLPRVGPFVAKTLTLEQIFSDDHNWTATLSARRTRTLIATGDVVPARSVNFKATLYKNFKWPFEKTAEILKKADITLINLESPLLEGCPLTNTGMTFCGDPRHIEGFNFAGVDVANLANNHIEDYGVEGVTSTLEILGQESEILASGLTTGAVVKNIRGLKFAFLGYEDVNRYGQAIALAQEEAIIEDIKTAKKEADLVIVSFHWGVEYTRLPTERQKELAHLAIDSGADLIIGNHPHWIQPVEIYKSKLIIYSHGNFIFDQMWSEETKIGVVGRYVFYDDKLIDVEFLPIRITDFGQPYFQEGKEKEKILEDLESTSILRSNARIIS